MASFAGLITELTFDVATVVGCDWWDYDAGYAILEQIVNTQ